MYIFKFPSFHLLSVLHISHTNTRTGLTSKGSCVLYNLELCNQLFFHVLVLLKAYYQFMSNYFNMCADVWLCIICACKTGCVKESCFQFLSLFGEILS